MNRATFIEKLTEVQKIVEQIARRTAGQFSCAVISRLTAEFAPRQITALSECQKRPFSKWPATRMWNSNEAESE
jgi:hypothetical protein